MPIAPSSSTFYSSSLTSSSVFSGISTVPKSSPTLIANVNTLLLEFAYSPDGPECSINPDASGRGTSERRKRYVPTGSPLNIRFLYETLSKALNITISKLQYNEFSSAIIEIAEQYLKACKAPTRTSTTIYTLYDQLIEVRESSASNKANLLRRILAKTLCSHTRNKRQSVDNPNSTDFFHLITDFEARNIFGFNFYEWSHRNFPTLAFVVDTTGSMANAIAGVKEAIKSIIALEQHNPFFYILTPFNDYDRDARYRNVSSKSCQSSLNLFMLHVMYLDLDYGPNYIATTRSDVGDPYRELKNLYSVVSNLTADSGGDEPEYCMGGILEAFRASRTGISDNGISYNINFYSEASQIIVITDATAKDASLLSNVTEIVRHTRVKVHFILASESVSSYPPYQSIATISGGLVINSTFEIDKVIQTLAFSASKRTGNTPIINASLLRNKRSAENCNIFGISLFTSQISALFMQNISLTYPNGTTTQIPGPNTFTVESPDAGQWAVCSAGQVYCPTQTVMHYTVTFLDSKFSISENLPSVCKSAWL